MEDIPRSAATFLQRLFGGEEDFEFVGVPAGDLNLVCRTTACGGFLLDAAGGAIHFCQEGVVQVAEG